MKRSPFGIFMVQLQMLLASKQATRPSSDGPAAATPSFMNMMRVKP